MLWFLHLALEAKFIVDRYVDEAVGVLDRTWMSKVMLRPRVTFSGRAPSDEEHRALHHKAHEKCFIANSIKSEVIVEPGIDQR
jgi:organic hydroperoxide reductase OsmC/OhrA